MPSSSKYEPRHHDLMEGLLSESNTSYKANVDFQAFAPRPLGLGITPLHCSCLGNSMARPLSMKSGFRGLGLFPRIGISEFTSLMTINYIFGYLVCFVISYLVNYVNMILWFP